MEQIYDGVAVLGGGPGGYSSGAVLRAGGAFNRGAEKLSPGGPDGDLTSNVENYPGFAEGVTASIWPCR